AARLAGRSDGERTGIDRTERLTILTFNPRMGSNATTKARRHEELFVQACLRVFVSSWLHFALAAVFVIVAVVSATAAPARQPGVPPKFLNIVRQTLKRGAAPAYLVVESTIVCEYDRSKFTLYWLCLQSPKTPPEIL